MTIEPQCYTCKHFDNDGKWGCKAFVTIPDDILTNKVIHDKVIDGQRGQYIYSEVDSPPWA